MPDQRISKRVVDSLRPKESEYTIWDTDVPGFGIRVRPNGAMSYIAVYRSGHGRKAPVRKLTLSSVGRVTPDEARGLARKAIGAVAHGRDPAAEKTASRRSMTVSELAEAFLAEHVLPKRKATTVAGYVNALRGHLVPELGTLKADQLTRAVSRSCTSAFRIVRSPPTTCSPWSAACMGSGRGGATCRKAATPPIVSNATRNRRESGS